MDVRALLALVGMVCAVAAQGTDVDVNQNASSTIAPAKECLTARNVSGVCVQRNSCDYSTGAIDLTLFAPHGYERPCELAEVCCPQAAIVHTDPVPTTPDSDEDDD